MTTWATERHPPIPGYEPIRVLGQNGTIVYVARSARFEKPVALQVCSNRTLPANVAAMVGLEHPNILGVLDVGEVAGHLYVALEYLEGVESLSVRLRRGSLPEADARGLASVAVSVLQFLRERGVTVATPTPGDVLLGETPKLMLHSAGGHCARHDFMAPEEMSHKQATAAAIDVYRVGALLYAMLTGRSPVSLDSVRSTGWRSVPAPVPVRQINPSISKTLEAVCMKCLAERPLDRYGSLEELIELVNRSAQAASAA